MQYSDEELETLFAWVDSVPTSRPKKNFARDFSDAVLTAEIIHHFYPRLVELHNYIPANNVNQKRVNWETLNKKVLSKIGLGLTPTKIRNLSMVKCGVAEAYLKEIYEKMTEHPNFNSTASISKEETSQLSHRHSTIVTDLPPRTSLHCTKKGSLPNSSVPPYKRHASVSPSNGSRPLTPPMSLVAGLQNSHLEGQVLIPASLIRDQQMEIDKLAQRIESLELRLGIVDGCQNTDTVESTSRDQLHERASKRSIF